MIGTIQVKISAHSPQMPLCPIFAFQDSYQQIRICDVPKKIGDWSIKRVEVECQFPDNKVGKFDCSLIGGVWATTISACSTAGTTTNGFVVNGYDENGNKYILGKSDLYIMTNDSRIVPQKELVVVNILPNKPDTPHIGDMVVVDGKFEIYYDEKWISNEYSNEYIESEDGHQRIYGNGDVFALSSGAGTYGPWTDNDGNVDETWHIEEMTSLTSDTFWAWKSNDNGQSLQCWYSYEAAAEATSLWDSNSRPWTRSYVPGTETWTKEDELALKSDIPTKTSQLTNDSNLLSATKNADGYYNIDVNKAYLAEADTMGRQLTSAYATKEYIASSCYPLSGGVLSGNLFLNDNFIRIYGLTSEGVYIASNSNKGQQGYILVGGGQDLGGRLVVNASFDNGKGGSIDVNGEDASITKNGKEVATIEYVDNAIGNVLTQEEF